MLEYDKQGRDNKQKGDCSNEHASDSTNTDRYVTIGANACREHHRKHSEDHGERGHQDWAKTNLGGGDGRLGDTHALMTSFGSVFRKKDRRFR